MHRFAPALHDQSECCCVEKNRNAAEDFPQRIESGICLASRECQRDSAVRRERQSADGRNEDSKNI